MHRRQQFALLSAALVVAALAVLWAWRGMGESQAPVAVTDTEQSAVGPAHPDVATAPPTLSDAQPAALPALAPQPTPASDPGSLSPAVPPGTRTPPQRSSTPATPATPRSQATDAPAEAELHESGLPYRDIFTAEDTRDAFGRAIPGLAECHRLLIELDDTVPGALTMRLEGLVVPDPDDADLGRIQLQFVDSPELQLDDIACFAEVFDTLRVNAPEGDGYAFRAETSTRVETE